MNLKLVFFVVVVGHYTPKYKNIYIYLQHQKHNSENWNSCRYLISHDVQFVPDMDGAVTDYWRIIIVIRNVWLEFSVLSDKWKWLKLHSPSIKYVPVAYSANPSCIHWIKMQGTHQGLLDTAQMKSPLFAVSNIWIISTLLQNVTVLFVMLWQ